MGKRGPKSSHPSGEGTINKAGYHRIQRGGRLVMAHRWFWEQANGPIPERHDIHHRNRKRSDNRLCNLQLVDKLTHKRIHSGCELRDGIWWKPCSNCAELKPVNLANWYISKEGWPLYGRCRPCHIRRVVESKRLRRLRKKAEAAQGL